MTTVRFDPQGLRALLDTTSSPVAGDLARRAVKVERAVKQSLKQPGRGRLYRRRGVVHRASAPGSPPATDLGRLAAATTWEVGRDERGLVARIGSNYRVQLYLELGTRRMAPRPHLRPALAEAGR